MAIKIKRIYELRNTSDGYRILIDRLWPRGVSKTDAHIDQWMKEVAPSTALRKWFDHDPKKWTHFLSKYRDELNDTNSLKELEAVIKKHKVMTLLYAAKDEQRNHAVALLRFITK